MTALSASTQATQITALVSLSNAVVVLLVIALLACAGFFMRSHNTHPWTAILVAALTAGVCFTVGGESAADSPGPSVATVFGGIVGVLCVAAGIIALIPRDGTGPPSRVPSLLASGAVALGAIGLLLNLIFG